MLVLKYENLIRYAQKFSFYVIEKVYFR